MFVASTKVGYCRNRQKYINILQEIANQIPTDKTPLFIMAGVSELKTGGNNKRNTSAKPAEGEHLSDGTLYTGSYTYKQWVRSAVTPHHNKICASREERQGKHKSNDYKKGRQQKLKVSKSAPKSRNWSQPSNDWFPILQPKAIMANPQEGGMNHNQAPHLVEDLRMPTNDSFGVHYCVG